MLFHIQVMTALACLINSNNAFEMTRGRWRKYATPIRTSSNILRVNDSSNRQENFFVSTNNDNKKASRSQSRTTHDRFIHSPIDTGTRLYYQESNDDQMDQHQHILNDDSKISLKDVRMGLLGKPAKTSEEDLELTRQIIMNQWDIELTRTTVMDITATAMPLAKVVGVKVEKETVPSKIETAELVSILAPMLDPLPTVSPKTIRRTSIRGVSISPSGFLVLIMTQTGYSDGKTLMTETTESSDPLTIAGASTNIFQYMTLPIPITSNVQDTIAATTPESLTMCQLLTGIDMAGTIFNPEVLQNIVGIYCSPEEEFDYDNGGVDDDINTYEEYVTEEKEAMEDVNMFVELSLLIEKMNEVLDTSESDTTNGEEHSSEKSGSTRQYIRTILQSSLEEHNALSYQEADLSQRASVSFPKITLDSITIDLPNLLEQTQTKARALEYDSDESDGNIDDKKYVENKELWKNIVLKDVQEKSPRQGQQEQDSPTTVPLPLQFTLECRVDGDKTLHVPIYTQISTIQRKYPHLYYDTNSKAEGSAMPMEMALCKEILQDVLYDYDGDCSGAFVAMALASRYNCPIGITSCAIAAVSEVQHQLEKGNNLKCESESSSAHTGSDYSNTNCKGLHVCMLKKTSSPSVSARTDTSILSSNQERTLSHHRIHNECFDSEEEIDDNIDYNEDYIEDIVPDSKAERSKLGLTQDNSDDDDDYNDIISILPDFKSLSSLRFQSQRIVQDIQLSFRLNQLQSALSIALEKGDDVAAERIKNAISKLVDTM